MVRERYTCEWYSISVTKLPTLFGQTIAKNDQRPVHLMADKDSRKADTER